MVNRFAIYSDNTGDKVSIGGLLESIFRVARHEGSSQSRLPLISCATMMTTKLLIRALKRLVSKI